MYTKSSVKGLAGQNRRSTFGWSACAAGEGIAEERGGHRSDLGGVIDLELEADEIKSEGETTEPSVAQKRRRV